jgi:hypothetical protein
MSTVADDDIINLLASDGELYQVLYSDIKTSKTVTNLLEDLGLKKSIPIPSVDGKTLKTVIEYCKTANQDDWASKFTAMTLVEMQPIIAAANYLDMPVLLDLTTDTIAKNIKGKTPEQLRVYLDIKGPISKNDEQEMIDEMELK